MLVLWNMMSETHINNISMNSIPGHLLMYWLRLNNKQKSMYTLLWYHLPISIMEKYYVLNCLRAGRTQSAVAAGLINTAWLIDNIRCIVCKPFLFPTFMSRPLPLWDHKSTVFKGSKIFLLVITPFSVALLNVAERFGK